MPDLHHKLPILFKFQNMPVGRRTPSDPNVSILVHINSVLVLRPIKSFARSAPGMEQVSLLVEFQHRRRSDAAHGTRRRKRSADFIRRVRGGPLQNPDVVLPVHSQPADLPSDPVVRQLLRPERLNSILRCLLREGSKCTSAKQNQQRDGEAHQAPCRSLAEKESVHEALRVNDLPQFRIGAEYRTAPAMCQRTCRYVGRREWNPIFSPLDFRALLGQTPSYPNRSPAGP